MVALASAVVTVIAWLLLRRWPPHAELPSIPAWSASSTRAAWAAALLATIASQIPLLRSASPLLVSDATGHAAIAAALATHGAPHGWIDVFNGGFPLGLHYPPLGWILIALSIRCGASPALAVAWSAILATAAVPVIALAGARGLGARPIAALACALAIGCAAPFSPFVGGWGAFLEQGLLSQAIVMPFAVAFVVTLPSPRVAWLAPIFAAASMAAHPQVATSSFFVAGVTTLAAGDARARRALLASAVAAGALGAALYIPGALTMKVPFGWPPMDDWTRIGFPGRTVLRWLDRGELLDMGRAPVVTSAWAAGVAICATRLEARACRAALLGTIAAMLGASSGQALDALGSFGAAVITLFQPLRALAVLPLAAGATILVAVEEAAAGAAQRVRGGRWNAPAAWLALGLAAAPVVMDRAEFGEEVRGTFQSWTANDWCASAKPIGYDTETIVGWMRSLPRGRFTITKGLPLENCPATHGVELASPVPMGRPIGAGAHVGVNHVAFRQLRLEEAGSDRRAESLGIRSVLHTRAQDPPEGSAFHTVAQQGDMRLSVREGGTDFVGVGCVEREVRGSNKALHDALIADLQGTASVLRDPARLVRLAPSPDAPLEIALVPRGECDPSGAIVEERPREPGAYEAAVKLLHPADVVVRASAFPTWELDVDGVRAPIFAVAPGFFAARVGPGDHHIVAKVAAPRGYAVGVALALLAVVGCAVVTRRASRSSPG